MVNANVKMLITRPDYDDTTFYCKTWSEHIIELASKKIKFVELKDKKVTKKNVTGMITSHNPKFLFFNGHGNPKTITGHNHEPLITEGENESLLKSKIVLAVTCGAANSLGHAAVKSGDGTFIGFDGIYMFPYDETRTAKPLMDERAKPFFETTNSIAVSIINGHTTEESYDKAMENYGKWIEYYRVNGDDPNAPIVLPFLLYDITLLKILGNTSATIAD